MPDGMLSARLLSGLGGQAVSRGFSDHLLLCSRNVLLLRPEELIFFVLSTRLPLNGALPMRDTLE